MRTDVLKMNFALFSGLCSDKLYDLLFPNNDFELNAVLRQMQLEIVCFMLCELNAKVFIFITDARIVMGSFLWDC